HRVADIDPLLHSNFDIADFDNDYLPEFSHISLGGWDSDVDNQLHNLWLEDDSSDLSEVDNSAIGGDIKFIPGLTELASQETINRVLWSQQDVHVAHKRWTRSLEREDMYSQELGMAELFYLEASPAPLLPLPPIPELVEDKVPLSVNERLEIEATSHAMLHQLDAMTMFIGTVCTSAVPPEERNAWRQMAWELFTTTWRLSETMSVELAAAPTPLDLTSPAAFRASYVAVHTAQSEPQSGEPSSPARCRRPRGPRGQQRRN
ncbi:hypothetical protein L208DRAFT_1529314, partial [Tricholoma matsutake]